MSTLSQANSTRRRDTKASGQECKAVNEGGRGDKKSITIHGENKISGCTDQSKNPSGQEVKGSGKRYWT